MKKAQRSSSYRLLLFGARSALFLVIFLFLGLTSNSLNSEEQTRNEHGRVRRDAPNVTDVKNSTSNASHCIVPSIEEFPPDFLTSQQRSDGGVVIHVLILLYLLAVLSVVCDDYFMAALERICKVLKLRPDVAGATFMAAGSSSPEFFTSLIGVFVAKSDVGLGTIVGSAVFNVLFIVAVCSLVTAKVLVLSWYPMTRDCLYYLLSVVAVTSIIYDESVEWYESMILLIMYAIYITIMYFNTRIERVVSMLVLTRGAMTREEGLTLPHQEETQLSHVELNERPAFQPSDDGTQPDTIYGVDSMAIEESVEDKHESIFDFPDSTLKRILWIVLLPASLLIFVTIPDCRKPCFHRFYALTFLMSVVWIAATSYIIVWMICIIGYTAGIPDSVMGLTFLAAGASMPEIISTVIVARKGESDMAISNSIGSNVFDLLLCLGLPWFLSSAVIHPGVPVHINSAGLTYSAAMLLSTVIILLVGTWVNKWKLNVKYGTVLLLIWTVVIVLMCLFELNVFGDFRPPTCAFD